MGLFSFLKNAGAKLFNKNDNAKTANEGSTPKTNAADALNKQKAALLKGAVEGLGLKIENLDIQLDDETVTVYGDVSSYEDREKVILALGNVEGVSAVDDRITVNTPEPESKATFYEVKKGDTLYAIAKEHYGNGMKYPSIFEANKPMLKSADLIYPGQVLRIPDLDKA